MRRLAALLLACAATAPAATAHDGPPYPILVDEELAGRTVSVWADPDVGTGTFFVYLDAPLPAALSLGAMPVDGRLAEEHVLAEAAEDGEPFDLVAEVPFDERGPWRMRFVVEGPDGPEELVVVVEVTPPGLGPIDLLWYASPFAAIAFLWIKVAVQRRRLERNPN